ncbi:hypothetical protein K2173_018822 [Erythroxylum novogranatense]|uniref:Uncharacterized protein n=1 Tax=Erythroxylum novogranatense TaxID=1862640 RepID=A0AAV8T1Y4_9ROSI|nr:hypothetical protein K2173_018822 [Erythroxylum novogranatense]
MATYPAISDDFQTKPSSLTPSAPPPSNSQDETTVATGVLDPFDLINGSNAWSTGLCDCFSDIGSCCLTCWCPCIAFGRIAEMVDRGSTSCGVSGALYTLILCLTGCSCLYSSFYRSKLRGQYFLEESPCGDCCIHFCCEECALCQEYRELKKRGFDLSIGWHANVKRHKRLTKRAPEVGEGMIR